MPIFNELARSDNSNVQVDHMWPKSLLMSKKAVRKEYPTVTDEEIESFKSMCNELPNLQLLSTRDNQDKADICYGEWLDTHYPEEKKPERDNYILSHFVPTNVTYEFSKFADFFQARRALLESKIKEAFPSDYEIIVQMNNLSDKV